MKKSYPSLFVIIAFLLEKKDREGGVDALSSVEDKQGRKYCAEKLLEEITHKAASVSQCSGLDKNCSDLFVFVYTGHRKEN